MNPGYEALRETAAYLDLSTRGRIIATGEDRARLLHAMTTNQIQQLQPGQGCSGILLVWPDAGDSEIRRRLSSGLYGRPMDRRLLFARRRIGRGISRLGRVGLHGLGQRLFIVHRHGNRR